MTTEGTAQAAEKRRATDIMKKRFENGCQLAEGKHGEQALIGIHGESMGAVTTLLYAGMDDAEADFYVADCPFATFEDQLIYRLKEDFHLPGAFILPLASLFFEMAGRLPHP